MYSNHDSMFDWHFRCSIVDSFRVVNILIDYLGKVQASNPKAYEEMKKRIEDRCGQPNDSERNQSVAKRFRCWITTIDGVVEEFQLVDDWKQTKQRLEPLVNELENCTNLW